MHSFSVVFTVLTVFILSVLGAPLPSDLQLDKRSYSGQVRGLLDSRSCPDADWCPPRGHGSMMAWVHVVNTTPTPIVLSPSPPSYMGQEAVVTWLVCSYA